MFPQLTDRSLFNPSLYKIVCIILFKYYLFFFSMFSRLLKERYELVHSFTGHSSILPCIKLYASSFSKSFLLMDPFGWLPLAV